MIKKMKENQKGFTLVELIVVIAILAVLALLLVPRILGNVGDAKRSSALADARVIASEVNTHNALVAIDDAEGGKGPIKAEATDNRLVDSELGPIEREDGKTLEKAADLGIYVEVDEKGNASVFDENAEE